MEAGTATAKQKALVDSCKQGGRPRSQNCPNQEAKAAVKAGNATQSQQTLASKIDKGNDQLFQRYLTAKAAVEAGNATPVQRILFINLGKCYETLGLTT